MERYSRRVGLFMEESVVDTVVYEWSAILDEG